MNLDSALGRSYRRASVGGVPQLSTTESAMSPTEVVVMPQEQGLSPREQEVADRLKVLKQRLRSLRLAPPLEQFEYLTEACRASRHFRMYLYWACCESGKFSTPVVRKAIREMTSLVRLAGSVARFESKRRLPQVENEHQSRSELAQHYKSNLKERLRFLKQLYRQGVDSLAPPRRKVNQSGEYESTIEPERMLVAYACNKLACALEKPILTELEHEAGPFQASVCDHLEHIRIALEMARSLLAATDKYLLQKVVDPVLNRTQQALFTCVESIETRADELSKISRSAHEVEKTLRTYWTKTLVPEFTNAVEALTDAYYRLADPFPLLRNRLTRIPLDQIFWLAEVQHCLLSGQVHSLPWSPATTSALVERYATIIGDHNATDEEKRAGLDQVLFHLAYSASFWTNEKVETPIFLRLNRFSKKGFQRFCSLLHIPQDSKSAALALMAISDIHAVLLLFGNLNYEFGQLSLKSKRRKAGQKKTPWEVEVIPNSDYFIERFEDGVTDECRAG